MVKLSDWLKLGSGVFRIVRKIGHLQRRGLAQHPIGNPTRRVMMALRRLGRLNAQAQIDQLCIVWYDTRATMLGNLIAQKKWVASQPLAVMVLSGLQG